VPSRSCTSTYGNDPSIASVPGAASAGAGRASAVSATVVANARCPTRGMVRVPVWTVQRCGPSVKPIERLVRPIFDVRTYGRILYLLLALPLGVAEFSFLVTAISFGFGTAITLIGIPVLVGTVWAWRWLAELERRLIGRLIGVEIPTPYRPDPTGARWWKRVAARLSDPATWKDLAFLLLQLPLGILSFTVAATVLGVGLGALFAPAYYWALPDGTWLTAIHIDAFGEALAVVPAGALILLLGIPGLSALGRLYGWLAAQLLGSNADPELTAQVTELQDARSRIIAAADAERRRIERDLHDGAQQRLVALALNLRMAEQRAESGDPAAGELVRQAGEEANLALKELRDLARGIHPAILTNRGLAAALEDLAARATVPVEVTAAPDERLPDAVEAAAYFVVSECLANIGKHAQASSATVSVSAADGHLAVVVADDGVGGAALGDGSGIQGLADRVGALNGSLAMESPPGEGTRVVASIPLTEEAAEEALSSHDGPRILSAAEADELQGERRQHLLLRTASLGIVAAVLVVIWALTGPDLPWIVWPLLGIGLIAGLDAWRVLSMPPLSDSDLTGAEDREDALRRLRRRRRLRHHLGAHVILNAFIVGVWLASGSSYFWPAWVMLGSGIAAALKALPRPARAHRHMLGDYP
jgi:signal transduction histidine kinase